MTTSGDQDGLHVLAADESTGYQWHTVATLAEQEFDTDQWIGQACVTGSGERAAVVYAPRSFSNLSGQGDIPAFAAIVDLRTGAVRKLAVHASLAYYDPGCGTGEQVAFSVAGGAGSSTRIDTVDAASGRTLNSVTAPGQVTSAVPYQGGLAASSGGRLISISSTGRTAVLSGSTGVAFRLHPDRSGGLGYEVAVGSQAQVRRWSGTHSSLLGSPRLDSVRLTADAGNVFLVGPAAGQVHSAAGWRRLTSHSTDDEPSSTGALLVTDSARQRSGPASQQVRIEALAGGHAVRFTVETGTAGQSGFRPSPAMASLTSAESPGRSAGSTSARSAIARSAVANPQTADPGSQPFDPDAGCAVPRNDPTKQSLQASAAQVEWAVDQAVAGRLLVTRPANWDASGMAGPWQPQVLFKPHPLTGGGSVPAQVLLGILAQESNTLQTSPHAVDGLTGNFNQGGFYGNQISWSSVDCGYGVGQVTTGMAMSDGHSVYSSTQQQAIATDYASNIAASLNALVDKWNQLKSLNILANNADPQYIENWYLAAWAYNTGLQPNAANGNTGGCAPSSTCTDNGGSGGNWGLGWTNNPADPMYPEDRAPFNANDDFDIKHPNLWPYPEKMLGWARTPVARYDYADKVWAPAYAPGYWNVSDTSPDPDYSTFCTAADHCTPKVNMDLNGKVGAGLCNLSNSHCWWHDAVTWVTCHDPDSGNTRCGTQVITYPANSPEPATPSVYPADCSTSSLASNTAIVDEVTTGSGVPCHKTWPDQGSFALQFPYTPPAGCTSKCINYPGKIDFHQLGTGFGGHLWFTHTSTKPTVTGTWTPPAADSNGWTDIRVHILDSGAPTTKYADYLISLGNGQTRHRIINQNWWGQSWLDLGSFNLRPGASVSLSNFSNHVAAGKVDGGDIDFDALAFTPASAPSANYVALGDSYSAGESTQPYQPDTDVASGDECHRSLTQAYSSMVTLPGHSQPIAAESADGTANFHSLACSGSESIDMTQSSVDTTDQNNTDWRVANDYHDQEVNQIDDSGWVDADTTLVTLTIGGNDVGFSDVIQGCLKAPLDLSLCTDSDYRLTREHDSGTMPKNLTDPVALTSYEPTLIGKLQSHLESVYQKIHVTAPNAKIVVIGYPRLFDPNGVEGCDGVTPGVQAWLNQMADQMTATISAAVSSTKTAYPTLNIRFIDATSGFTGHAVCENSSPEWLNGVDLINQNSSFHPNHNGQLEYGKLVNAALAQP